jgi:predicted RNase H-like nuclease (RuvC/YqgF family)
MVVTYFLWKSKNGALKDDTIKAYKEVIEAYDKKLSQFETDLGELKDENKFLQAQVNQLIGENKALKNVKPSAVFETKVIEILGEIKTLRTDFVSHSGEDNTRFEALGNLAKSNNDMLLKLCPQT